MTLTSFKANMFDITRNIPSEFRPPEGFAIADLFDAARQEEGRNKEHQKEFDQHMTGKAVKDGVLTESQVSTTLAFAIASQASINSEIDAKRKQASADYLMLEELNRSIGVIEGELEGMYGENFALNVLAELVEDGKISQEDYDRFAAITDPEERRAAIAAWLNEQIENGTLTRDDLKKHPKFIEWLGLREEAEAIRDKDAQLTKDGADIKDLSRNGINHASSDMDVESQTEIDNEADSRRAATEVDAQASGAFAGLDKSFMG